MKRFRPEAETGSQSYDDALRAMTERYEELVESLSILREMEWLDEEDMDISDLSRRILETIAFGLAVENCSLMLMGEDGEHLELRAACSPVDEQGRVFPPGAWTGWKFRIGEGVVGKVAELGEPVFLGDATECEDFLLLPHSPVDIRSLLCFPLRVAGKVAGVLNLSHSDPGFFAGERRHALALVAERAARILTNHLLREQKKEADALNRLIMKTVDDAILVFDRHGAIISANAAVENITGAPPDSFISGRTSWEDGVHPEDRERFKQCRSELLRSRDPSSLEYRYRDSGGRTRSFEQHNSLMLDGWGQVLGIVSVVRDATDRKQAEEELERYRNHLEELVDSRNRELMEVNRELKGEVEVRRAAERSLKQLAMIIEQTTDSVIVTDTSGVIEYVNPAFERKMGYASEEVVGKSVEILGSRHQGRNLHPQIGRSLAEGKVWTDQVTNEQRDGSAIEEEAIASPVWDEQGNIVNHVYVMRDITVQVDLEKQLRQAEKMRAIGTLAGGIAHDFNNILFSVLGYSKLAMEDLPPNSEVRGMLAEVVKGGQRAGDLVKQILDFSRQTDEVRKHLNLQAIVKEALKLIRGSMPPTIEVRRDIDPECGPVLADPTQIHQVVMNLCTNAYQAMREEGGALVVSLKEVVVDEATAAGNADLNPGRYVRLSVSDTGSGMDPETLRRCFEPYFSTRKGGEGTGLGLATVHGIVKSHHGAIGVRSSPEGTTFHVYFPRADEAEASRDESGSERENLEGSERLLVVDDEEQVVAMLRLSFERLGYTVTTFRDPEEALEAFRSAPCGYDVIITDQVMPKRTGLELAREALQVRPDIPIILCTGFSDVVGEEHAKAAGVREYVMKPIITDELARAIRRVARDRAE